MTNEQLAELIAQGRNDELLPLLWDKTRSLFHMLADKYYNSHKDRCQAAGIAPEDMRQESYFALLEAVKYYAARSNEQQGLLFTTFCRYPAMTRFAAITGTRTAKQRNEPLNRCTSLDAPVISGKGEEVATIGECVPDETAGAAFDLSDDKDERRYISGVLSTSVSELPENEQAAIKGRYYESKSLQEVAAKMNISRERVRQLERHGLVLLRKQKRIRALYSELNYYKPRSAAACMRYGSSVESITELRERIQNELAELERKAGVKYPPKQWRKSGGVRHESDE